MIRRQAANAADLNSSEAFKVEVRDLKQDLVRLENLDRFSQLLLQFWEIFLSRKLRFGESGLSHLPISSENTHEYVSVGLGRRISANTLRCGRLVAGDGDASCLLLRLRRTRSSLRAELFSLF